MNDLYNLLEIMENLRDKENGCPWCAGQEFSTIAPYTIEEAYEVADAIHRNDMNGLRDELGDLLFQVVFHARLAEEMGKFDFQGVVENISEKMIRRHPHVFGNEIQRKEGAQADSWEKIKTEERSSGQQSSGYSVLDGIAKVLPALKRAQKLGNRAASVGFDWSNLEEVRAKIKEEWVELAEAEKTGDRENIEEELGDLLFAIGNLGRHLKIDAENALSKANRKFENRFRYMEREAVSKGGSLAELDLSVLEHLWEQAKAAK